MNLVKVADGKLAARNSRKWFLASPTHPSMRRHSEEIPDQRDYWWISAQNKLYIQLPNNTRQLTSGNAQAAGKAWLAAARGKIPSRECKIPFHRDNRDGPTAHE